MERTGVFLPDDERVAAIELYQEAQNTPVITFGGPGSPDMAAVAWNRAQATMHGFALKAGLPEIHGYYGMDTATGEVVAP